MNIQTEAQNISAKLLSNIRVFAYYIDPQEGRDEEVEVHDQLFIDPDRKYLGTYDQWMTKGEVLEKLHFMINKAKEVKSSENTL